MIPARLTLVSASPRRRELLARLGLPFDVCPSDAPELDTADDGRTLAVLNAELKVRQSPLVNDPARVLLGADTLIELDGRFLGKPDGLESARGMLAVLAGRTHDVITGVCLSGPAVSSDSPFIFVSSAAVSHVTFRALSFVDIQAYLDGGEWEGKAGAYAIQGEGQSLVSRLEGDFDNVVGLPTSLIHDLLSTHYSHCRFL
ncbi:MAG TPA: Maf family protein [bacterium]